MSRSQKRSDSPLSRDNVEFKTVIQGRSLLVESCLAYDADDDLERLEEIFRKSPVYKLHPVIRLAKTAQAKTGFRWTEVQRAVDITKQKVFVLMNAKNEVVVCDWGLICQYNGSETGKLNYWPPTYKDRLVVEGLNFVNYSTKVREHLNLSTFLDKTKTRNGAKRASSKQTDSKNNEHKENGTNSNGSKRKQTDIDSHAGRGGGKKTKAQDFACSADKDDKIHTSSTGDCDPFGGENAIKGRALCIGNAKYANLSELNNPVRDAQALRNFFRERLQFQTELIIEAKDPTDDSRIVKTFKLDDIKDQDSFRSIVTAFAEQIRTDEMVVFAYAGHGMQGPHGNILLTLDAPRYVYSNEKEKTKLDAGLATLYSLQNIHDDMVAICAKNDQKPKGFLFFIDGCRDFIGGITRTKDEKIKNENNPSLSSSGSGSTTATQHIYVPGISGFDCMYSFSCAPGTQSCDGPSSGPEKSKHGAYTKALLAALEKYKNEEVSVILTDTCNSVVESTWCAKDQTAQRPWYHASVRNKEFKLFVKQ